MRTLKNVVKMMKYFSIFFIITLVIYFLILPKQENYAVILSNAMMHFFIIALVASIAMMTFLAATYKMARGIDLVLSVLIFSSMMLLLYSFVLYFPSSFIDNILLNDVFLSEDIDYTDSLNIEEGKFNIFNEYVVYAKNNIGDSLYSNIIISKNDSERVLYKANYGLITLNGTEINDVEVFNFVDMETKRMKTVSLTNFGASDDTKYIQKIFSKGVIFYIANLVLNVFVNSENSIYSMLILFVILFLLLLGSYSIVYSLSSPIHLFYNVLVAVVLCTLFELSLVVLVNMFGLDNIIKLLNFTLLSISLISIGVLLNIFAFVFKQVFSFRNYYE